MNRLCFVVTAVVVLSFSVFIGAAFAATYLGSGWFPTSTLARGYSNPNGYAGYDTPTQNAVAQWSADTNLNLYRDDVNWSVLTNIDWWDTTWAGYAAICSTNGQCENQSAYDNTYSWCSARLNHKFASGYNESQKQGLASHELGHCWSLDHIADAGSIMGPNTCGCLTGPNATDVANVNARYA